MNTYFNPDTWPLYLFGFITFLLTLSDDAIKRQWKEFLWYFREFIYTLISIAIGISVSIGAELSKSYTIVVVILMGLCGSTIIRKFLERKDKIIDNSLNSVDEALQEKIKNSKQNGNEET